MNKQITVMVTLFLVFSVLLFSVDKKQELYLKAIAEKSPEVKIQLLKDYVLAYGEDKNDKFMRFIYLNMADTTYRVKNYDETIQFGEKALEYPDVDQNNKLRMCLYLANAYFITKKDLVKANKYADTTIEIATKIANQAGIIEKDKEKAEQLVLNYKTAFIAPAYRIQASILYTNGDIPQAAVKALEAFNSDKSENSSKTVLSLAVNLYQKGKVDDAIKIAEQIIDPLKPKFQEANFLATAYYKQGNKDKAVTYFELAYKAKPSAEQALRLGQLIYKKDAEKAIEYFADSFILSSQNKESEAFKYLQQLYFNQVAKDKTEEEKEAGYNAILAAATARVNVDTENATATESTEKPVDEPIQN